ncbi:MAG: hypothetical protein A3D92_04795 [Bacteroidetes bacterium RIFCSPHIGHO2_02_FULL_44_7]|nr:MAG: hypothetical protein A3D92_04795 [Bacteroidetes bacterium RIFCSPHIGHO2_02_FULL_44_7]
MKTPTVKMALLGLGTLAAAGVLVSFTLSDQNKDKMKRYQVIHHSNGVSLEFDTIVSMESNYTVEQFLADKGIQSDNVKIIRMPAMGDHAIFVQDEDFGEGERIIVREFTSTEETRIDGVEGKEVRITKEIGPDGTVVMKKFVDGKEVELTPEESEGIEMRSNGGREHTTVVRMRGDEAEDDQLEWNGKEEQIQIKCEIDADGKMHAQKWVNGEEVPLTEQEMEQFRTVDDDGKHVVIRMESSENGVPSEEMEIKIQQLIEEMGTDVEGQDERKMVIIKQIEEGDGEGVEEHVLEINGSEDVNWTTDEKVHVEFSGDDAEDFTIVIVTENFEGQRISNMDRVITQNEVQVFPNPTSGLVTIRLEQSEKVKTAISIADMSGKVVFKESLGKFSGAYSKEIDLHKFGKGTYVVSIEQGSDIHVEKIVVE